MTIGEIHREFAAGRLTASEAADLTMALRERPSFGAWKGLAFVVVLAATTYCLLGVAFNWRMP